MYMCVLITQMRLVHLQKPPVQLILLHNAVYNLLKVQPYTNEQKWWLKYILILSIRQNSQV